LQKWGGAAGKRKAENGEMKSLKKKPERRVISEFTLAERKKKLSSIKRQAWKEVECRQSGDWFLGEGCGKR